VCTIIVDGVAPLANVITSLICTAVSPPQWAEASYVYWLAPPKNTGVPELLVSADDVVTVDGGGMGTAKPKLIPELTWPDTTTTLWLFGVLLT